MTSTIKVNNIQNQCGANIINESSDTITIGASGDTIALASGASQTGFGKTGAVDWDTSNIKTSTFTAVSGNGYFCNTSGGAFNITLPSSPSAGAIVGIKDYTGTFNAYNLTVDRNGSKLNGATANKALATNYLSLTLVYIDATEGWVPVEEGTGFIGEDFVTATGGTITTSGNDKIHTFTGPGTFTVCTIASCATNNLVSYVVIAGGGSGGHGCSGGGAGGAGGYRETKSPVTPYTASPLCGYSSAPNRITVSAQSYPIVVGAGATAKSNPNVGGQGSTSSFSTISSAGGGGGGKWSSGGQTAGGSGGGSAQCGGSGGAGNTPPVTPSQGNAGGNNGHWQMAGGGGAGAAGTVGHAGPPCGSSSNRNGKGGGGAGVTSSINGTPTARAGGGGGGFSSQPSLSPATDFAPGGTGGGGAGGPGPSPAMNGVANTGGGGGGAPQPNPGTSGAGGSGIVIIRYKYQ